MPVLTLVNPTVDTTLTYPGANGTIIVSSSSPSLGNTLSWNGSAWVASAPGLSFFTESQSTTSPNNTVYANSLTAVASVTNADFVLRPKGTGALLAQIPDDLTTGGIKRGANAVDFQTQRFNNYEVATGQYSVVMNGTGNRASNQYAICVGGSQNSSTGQYGFIGGGANNTTSNSFSVAVGGQFATASNGWAFVGAGYSNTASGLDAAVVAGRLCSATQEGSFVGGGLRNTASGYYSSIVGGRRGTTRDISGLLAIPACNAPVADATGVSQAAILVLGRQTTDATLTTITSDSGSASTNNQVILPNNSAYYFKGSVIAGVTGAGNTKAWSFEGVIKRGANAASTSIVGSTIVSVIAQDAGASTWTIALVADTTNGGLQIQVTGQLATTIRWVAKVETTEMTF